MSNKERRILQREAQTASEVEYNVKQGSNYPKPVIIALIILVVVGLAAYFLWRYNNEPTSLVTADEMVEKRFAISNYRLLYDCLYNTVNNVSLENNQDDMFKAKIEDLQRQIHHLNLYVGAYEKEESDVDILDLERQVKNLKDTIDHAFKEFQVPTPDCQIPNLIIDG